MSGILIAPHRADPPRQEGADAMNDLIASARGLQDRNGASSLVRQDWTLDPDELRRMNAYWRVATHQHGKDLPEVRNWRWGGAT